MSWVNFADETGHGPAQSSRYRLVWGKNSVRVERIWEKGLSVKADEVRRVPGLADLYQGDRHVASVLLCSEMVEGGEHHFHFKRLSLHADEPPRDYALVFETSALLPPPDIVRAGF